jgi:hypothetical protein
VSTVDFRAARGSFHGQYLKAVSQRDRRSKFPRLLDCLQVVVQRGDVQYLAAPEKGEFAVLDLQRREKGFFELPRGANPEVLHGMIEGHFGVAAERVSEFVWVV